MRCDVTRRVFVTVRSLDGLSAEQVGRQERVEGRGRGALIVRVGPHGREAGGGTPTRLLQTNKHTHLMTIYNGPR